MSDLRDRLLDALTAFEHSCVRLRSELELSETTAQAIRRSLLGGDPFASTVERLHIDQIRVSLTDSMADLERARHRMRALCFALAIEEGLSIGGVARLWGVSRQLAQRTIREVELPDPSPADQPSRPANPTGQG